MNKDNKVDKQKIIINIFTVVEKYLSAHEYKKIPSWGSVEKQRELKEENPYHSLPLSICKASCITSEGTNHRSS